MIGAFHLVHTQFYMLSGPPPPLFACNTQWKCIGDLNPPPPPLGAYVLNGRPHMNIKKQPLWKEETSVDAYNIVMYNI